MIADQGSDQQLIDHNWSTLKITDRDKSNDNRMWDSDRIN